MHYEEELDLLCRCIRANISIILHKTVYEINSTLLLRTHFKPPSSVCNNFILRSHTLWAAAVHYISSPKNRNPWLCHFSRDCTFKIAQLWGEKPRPWQQGRGFSPHNWAILKVQSREKMLPLCYTGSLYPFHIWDIISLAHCLSLSLSLSLGHTRSPLAHDLSLSLSSLSHTRSLSLSLSDTRSLVSTFASLSSSRAPHNHNNLNY